MIITRAEKKRRLATVHLYDKYRRDYFGEPWPRFWWLDSEYLNGHITKEVYVYTKALPI